MGQLHALKFRHVVYLAAAAVQILFASNTWSAPLWVARYSSSTNSYDQAENILLGRGGSVYVSGNSSEGGPATVAIVKYSSAGQRLWAVKNTNISRPYGGGALPLTALDKGGGVRIGGFSTADQNEIVLASYSSAGVFRWEQRFRPGVESRATALAVDASSNTVVVGTCESVTSFGRDVFLAKYSTGGLLLWNRSYPLNANYAAKVLTLPGGDILTSFFGSGRGLVVLKHSASGDLLWASENYVAGERPRPMKVDGSGNIFVADDGYRDGQIIKLNAKGDLLWQASVDSMEIQDLALDTSGSVYAAGEMTDDGTWSVGVVKIDAQGSELWRSRVGAPRTSSSWLAGIAAQGTGVSMGFSGADSNGWPRRFAAAHFNSIGVEVWRTIYTNVTGLAVAMVGDATEGIYLAGATDSSPSDFQTLKFNLAINPDRPTILSRPQSLDVMAGTNRVSFSVSAGNGPNKFQWRFNGATIAGATRSTLVLSNINTAHAGGYSVIVSNSSTYVVTPEARLTVRTAPDVHWESFRPPPTNQTLIVGNSLVLRASTSGEDSVQFEWRRDGVLLPHTNSTLMLEPLTAADAGTYTVTVRNPYGAATNTPISVRVLPRTAIDEWRWSRPPPQGNSLNSVAFGNGRFIAVGDLGTLLISTNGTDWAVTNLHNDDLWGVAFGNGTFVAIGVLGAIYTSVDGAAWTKRADFTVYSWYRQLFGVSFINNRFVVSGRKVYSSTDGVAWIDHGTPPSHGIGVAYGAGKYVMAGFGYVMVSTNLSAWTRHNYDNLFSEFFGVAYGNGAFVITPWYDDDVIYTSPDGAAITGRHTVSNAVNVAFLNGRFFSLGAYIETSPDGIVWTRVFESIPHSLRSIAYGNNLYVAVGAGGVMATSPDGQTWTRTPRGLVNLRRMAFANGRYVAVGNGAVWTSTDGEVWSLTTGPTVEEPSAITWANGTFVVVGARGELLTSRDGTSWTRVAVTTNDLKAVIHDGNRFAAVGERATLISSNAVHWEVIPTDLTYVGAVGFGNGTYLVSGSYYSPLQRSTNGLNWEVITNGPSLGALAYGNGRFVGVTSTDAWISSDGLQWSSNTIAAEAGYTSIIFAKGMFVAFGWDDAFATSTNGQDWVIHRTRAQGYFPGQPAYANGAFWMVGEHEAIIRSAQIEPSLRARKAGPAVELTVQAYPGQTYRLQRASTLGAWTDFQTFTPQSESATFTDSNTSQSAFYRIVPP